MKNKFLFSALLLLLFVGLYNPASYSQTYNMWLTNDAQSGDTAWSFDVYIQRTGDTVLSMYSFQIGFTYTVSALNGGTFVPGTTYIYVSGKSGWSNVDPTVASVETPKVFNTNAFANQPYIKCGFNVNSGGAGAGITIVSAPDSMRIGRIHLVNSVPFTGLPLITWYFGGAPGLPTKMQATTGSATYDVTTRGTFSYKNPHGGILPVELTSFMSNVSGREIDLKWETKTELNTRQFEIDRALVSTKDATVTWSAVGIIQATTTSTTPKKYSYTDKNLQPGKYQYRLKMIDNDGSYKLSDVVETEVALPKNFELSQNYPNPFNPSTKINYNLPYDSKVTLEVYNITGERIGQIVNQEQSAGYYSVNFSSSTLNRSIASGVYIYKINAVDKSTGNVFTSIKKMMLLK